MGGAPVPLTSAFSAWEGISRGLGREGGTSFRSKERGLMVAIISTSKNHGHYQCPDFTPGGAAPSLASTFPPLPLPQPGPAGPQSPGLVHGGLGRNSSIPGMVLCQTLAMCMSPGLQVCTWSLELRTCNGLGLLGEGARNRGWKWRQSFVWVFVALFLSFFLSSLSFSRPSFFV